MPTKTNHGYSRRIQNEKTYGNQDLQKQEETLTGKQNKSNRKKLTEETKLENSTKTSRRSEGQSRPGHYYYVRTIKEMY